MSFQSGSLKPALQRKTQYAPAISRKTLRLNTCISSPKSVLSPSGQRPRTGKPWQVSTRESSVEEPPLEITTDIAPSTVLTENSESAKRWLPELDAQLLALAVPALGVELIDPLLSVVDTAFVGRLGARELGGLGLAAAVFNVSFFLFNFLANATGPLVGQALAKNDTKGAARTHGQALTLAVGLGIGCAILLELFSYPILEIISGSHDYSGGVFDSAASYLRVRALGFPAALICTVNGGAFRGLLDTRTPLYVAVGANVLNLVLNPFLVFGWGPFPQLGVEGAALTTVVSEWLAACVGIYVLKETKIGAPDISLPKWSQIRPLLEASVALFFRTLALQSTFLLSTSIVSHTALNLDGSVDAAQIAAHQVSLQLWTLLAFVGDAVAVAAQSLVAESLGKDDQGSARRAADRALQYGIAMGCVLALGFHAGEDWLPTLFSDDAGVINATKGIFGYISGAQPINAVVFVFDGIFIGASDFGFMAAAVAGSGFFSALWMVLGGGGLAGVWQGLAVLQVGRGAGFGMRYWGLLGGPFGREEKSE